MYTAQSLNSPIVANGRVTVTVQYTNGTDTFTEDYWSDSGLDPAWLQNRVANKLKHLNTLLPLASSPRLQPQVFDGTWDHSSAAIPTTQDEWISNVNKLQNMQKAIDLGLLDSQDADFITLKSKVKGDFTKDYLTTVRL